MGQKQTSSRAATVDVGDPLHVQHTAQLKLDSRKGIVLQVPELDAYLRKVYKEYWYIVLVIPYF
jgi:hypothetical protein